MPLMLLLACTGEPTEKPAADTGWDTGWWDTPCDEETIAKGAAPPTSDDGDGWDWCEGDCDPNSAEINPDAEEICDGVDNNCDGVIDEEGMTTYYADGDGDGFGDASVAVFQCEPPTGYVANATDCDDSDARTYPGATELCDGIDNDCDGVGDTGDCPCDVYTEADHTYTFCGTPANWDAASEAAQRSAGAS